MDGFSNPIRACILEDVRGEHVTYMHIGMLLYDVVHVTHVMVATQRQHNRAVNPCRRGIAGEGGGAAKLGPEGLGPTPSSIFPPPFLVRRPDLCEERGGLKEGPVVRGLEGHLEVGEFSKALALFRASDGPEQAGYPRRGRWQPACHSAMWLQVPPRISNGVHREARPPRCRRMFRHKQNVTQRRRGTRCLRSSAGSPLRVDAIHLKHPLGSHPEVHL
mmetsp:Transcript_57832/g.146807  ORF Transcript_57832/g.146807 Transcript_57832/m.146807 type:complete len:218 (+) Transcript_57832:266-919(+)